MRDRNAVAGSSLSPLHAVILAFPVALYSSALLSDITYFNTAEIQWSNFSSWLIAGADFFAGILLSWAVFSFSFGRVGAHRGRGLLYLALVGTMFVLGLVNAFQHAKDGWHSVGTPGLVLSTLCTVLALVIALLAHSRFFLREKNV
ncbi:DUF2231 domain-containing protein [Qipengyuania sp. MTN3-11]|uniref:DUF2231 domain-containing protein n=1 Tax=Qipengyuania sp. MTN3-11 TaxID=3056557 RepID=UPI0036F24A5B